MLIVDLDGTLCDNTHRQHLLPKDGARAEHWEAFNKACIGDTLISDSFHLMQDLMVSFGLPIFVTGRAEHARTETKHWLHKHNINAEWLTMRQNNDHRKAVHYKRDVFMQFIIDRYSGLTQQAVKWEDIPAGYKRRVCILEDDLSIARMASELGLTVVLVPSACSAVRTGTNNKGSD